MEFKGIVLTESMILAGPAPAEGAPKPGKGTKTGGQEFYKIIRIHEPELIQREVHGGYDHTVELEPGQKPEITNLERFYTKTPLLIDLQEFKFSSPQEREAFKKTAKNLLMSHKEFDKWAKEKKLEVAVNEYGEPILDERDMKAEYAEMRRKRTA